MKESTFLETRRGTPRTFLAVVFPLNLQTLPHWPLANPSSSSTTASAQLQLELPFATDAPTAKRQPRRRAPLVTPAPILRAEANLLRFPFFALHTKGLRNCKGWSIQGKHNLTMLRTILNTVLPATQTTCFRDRLRAKRTTR